MSVVVRENGKGRYQQEVIAGEHRLIADEPFSLGGADAGPAPFDFLLAALGTCTSITLRMYAERKGLPLTGVDVRLRHERVEIAGELSDRIERVITLTGELTPAQRERMLEIAGRCPVARTLSKPLRIDDKLVENP